MDRDFAQCMKKTQDILAEADRLHSQARTGRVSLELYEKAIKLYRQSAEEFLSCKASTDNPDEIKTAGAWSKFALSRAAGDEAAVAYFGPKAGGRLGNC